MWTPPTHELFLIFNHLIVIKRFFTNRPYNFVKSTKIASQTVVL